MKKICGLFRTTAIFTRINIITGRYLSSSSAALDPELKDYSPVQLAHRVYEPRKASEKLPLIILHGLFGSKQNWKSLAKVYSADRKVVTVDLRCHGDSPQSNDLGQVEMSEDLKHLLSDLNLSKVDLLGHSLGGKVVMITALTKPELVNSLVCVDIAPAFSKGLVTLSEVLPAMNRVVEYFDPTFPLSTVRKDVFIQLSDDFPDAGFRHFVISNIVEKDGLYVWRTDPNLVSANWDKILGFPHFEYGTFFAGRTLFVGGEKSPYISAENTSEILRLFPKSKIIHIPDAGHWVHAEKSTEFLKITNTFFNGSSADS
ncbi:sn-1-specific diacylglycerol lipase ABHD11-like [Tubulanus polymorphus]|uniref:sn-1-specific diacylglycerol lipase ABHD11-like n=1 Tax=Tubulanus polymorphus TaxID=672921 RepID=UPI003DA54911